MILRILGMSPSRYHAWRRVALVCGLDDRSPCPRTAPGQLTAGEVATVKDMVLAPEYRHMPLHTLSLHAQRVGRVFASASTWARLVRDRGWAPPSPSRSSRQAHRRRSRHSPQRNLAH